MSHASPVKSPHIFSFFLSCPRRDSNSHCLPSEGSDSCQLVYAGACAGGRTRTVTVGILSSLPLPLVLHRRKSSPSLRSVKPGSRRLSLLVHGAGLEPTLSALSTPFLCRWDTHAWSARSGSNRRSHVPRTCAIPASPRAESVHPQRLEL